MTTPESPEKALQEVRRALLLLFAAAIGSAIAGRAVGVPHSLTSALPALALFAVLTSRLAWSVVRGKLPHWLAQSIWFSGWIVVGAAAVYLSFELDELKADAGRLDGERKNAFEIQRRFDELTRSYSSLQVRAGILDQRLADEHERTLALASRLDAKAAVLRANSEVAKLIIQGDSIVTVLDGSYPGHPDPMGPEARKIVTPWHDHVRSAIQRHYGAVALTQFDAENQERYWGKSPPWNWQAAMSEMLDRFKEFARRPGLGYADQPPPEIGE